MRWQDWAANACYVILAASYLVTNIYWLRILAVVALAFEGVYFYFGAEILLWIWIVWNVFFIANIGRFASTNMSVCCIKVYSRRSGRYGIWRHETLRSNPPSIGSSGAIW